MDEKLKLIDYLNKVRVIGKNEYQEIARLFEILVLRDIKNIWLKHKKKIDMRLNNIPICLEGSAVNSSTAFGFILEEFLVQQLSNEEYSKPIESTISSLYDFKFKIDEKIELLVNLKVEKSGGNNSGVCAGNILKNYYTRDSKPKLYLIVKSEYDINDKTSEVIFNRVSSVYLESFLTNKSLLKSDRRNWSDTFNVLSGRIQLPSKEKLANIKITDIPEPSEVISFISSLSEKLRDARRK